MTKINSTSTPDANALLDELLSRGNLKNDAALARELEVAPPVISKIRHQRLPVGATLMIRINEVFDMSIRDIKSFLGGAPA